MKSPKLLTFSSFSSPSLSIGIRVGTNPEGFDLFNSSAFLWIRIWKRVKYPCLYRNRCTNTHDVELIELTNGTTIPSLFQWRCYHLFFVPSPMFESIKKELVLIKTNKPINIRIKESWWWTYQCLISYKISIKTTGNKIYM